MIRQLARHRVLTLRAAVVLALLPLLLVQAAPSQTRQAQSIDENVAALVRKTLNTGTEQQAFADLESLGCPAVPAIIKQMDDRRKLPAPHISLKNKSSHSLEGMRNYAPEQVVDALAAILNQITGQDFGFIYNGATDQERTKAIRGWRNFLKNTPAKLRCRNASTIHLGVSNA